ncbi:hypothetical protein ABT224_18955 [Streptomyces sp. NPDC001584]|uniref:hypothetical protein n=1 Tax=Streptomyces sp. NPDC001584 TaxID=3154521 RepID=UPI0033288F8F
MFLADGSGDLLGVPAGDDGLLPLDVLGEGLDAALGGARAAPPGVAGDEEAVGSLGDGLTLDPAEWTSLNNSTSPVFELA